MPNAPSSETVVAMDICAAAAADARARMRRRSGAIDRSQRHQGHDDHERRGRIDRERNRRSAQRCSASATSAMLNEVATAARQSGEATEQLLQPPARLRVLNRPRCVQVRVCQPMPSVSEHRHREFRRDPHGGQAQNQPDDKQQRRDADPGG